MAAFGGKGNPAGMGACAVVVVAVELVDIVVVCVFFSERVEYIVAAVRPAPVKALAAAMIARVVLDILAVLRRGPRGLLLCSRRGVESVGGLVTFFTERENLVIQNVTGGTSRARVLALQRTCTTLRTPPRPPRLAVDLRLAVCNNIFIYV